MKYNDPTGRKATPGVYKVVHHDGKRWNLYAETNSQKDAIRMHGNLKKDGRNVKILDHKNNPINVSEAVDSQGQTVEAPKARIRRNEKHARPAKKAAVSVVAEEVINEVLKTLASTIQRGRSSGSSSGQKKPSGSGSSPLINNIKQRMQNLKLQQQGLKRQAIQAKIQTMQSKARQAAANLKR